MSGSPKMTNRLPLPVFFRSAAMCRSAFMRAFSTGSRPSRSNSVVWALVVEGAGDQQVELPVRRFAGGLDQVWPRDRAELRADEDRRAAQGALLLAALEIAPSAQTKWPGQGLSEVKAMRSSLCACCTPAALRFSRMIWAKS